MSVSAALFEARRVEVDGLGWRLQIRAGAPHQAPLILIHGYLAASYVLAPLARALAPRTERTLILVDLPGCGGSDRPADAPYTLPWLRDRLAALLDALDLDRAVILGHSLGGAVALHLAAEQPQAVTGLLLIAPLCFATPLPRILAPAARFPGFFRLFFRTLGRGLIAPSLLKNYGGVPPAQASELARKTIAQLDAPGGWMAATRMGVAAAFREPMEPMLPRVGAPALVIWGDRDRVHPPPLGERLARALPRARSLRVEGCGHNPHLERRDWLAEQISGWLLQSALTR